MLPKTLFTAIAAAMIATSSFAGQSDPVIDYDKHDARMNAAQDEARAHLDQFLGHVLDQNGIGAPGSGVKVAFPISGDSVEVIWVSPFGIRDGQMLGALANQPVDIEGKNAGDTVLFEPAQVRDWYFFGEDGKMYGSYTTRVMLPDLSKAEAEQISQMLSDSPIPTDW